MTSQTHKFIELSDILTLKLQCNDCGSYLAIPSSRDMTTREELGKLSDCPVCRKHWATISGASIEPTIYQFTGALNTLRTAMKIAPVGFSLTLEVADDHDEEADKTNASASVGRKARS